MCDASPTDILITFKECDSVWLVVYADIFQSNLKLKNKIPIIIYTNRKEEQKQK